MPNVADRYRGWLRSPLLWGFVASVVLFLLAPGLDLAASRIFWRAGEGFYLAGMLQPIHLGVRTFTALLAGGLIGGLLVANLVSAPWALRKRLVYLLLVLATGPGLMVNALFKDHWGRARPVQVQDFGGTLRFSPAWMIAGQCDTNCSFACGDASVGFALLAPAFVLPARRRFWQGLGITAGGLLGLMRMAQGGHFLSDVVFSFFIVYFAAWLLHRLLYSATSSGLPARP